MYGWVRGHAWLVGRRHSAAGFLSEEAIEGCKRGDALGAVLGAISVQESVLVRSVLVLGRQVGERRSAGSVSTRVF